VLSNGATMANPPDNKNPGNNNPDSSNTDGKPPAGTSSPAQGTNRGVGGKPSAGAQPTNETPPPLPKTAASRPPQTAKPTQAPAVPPAAASKPAPTPKPAATPKTTTTPKTTITQGTATDVKKTTPAATASTPPSQNVPRSAGKISAGVVAAAKKDLKAAGIKPGTNTTRTTTNATRTTQTSPANSSQRTVARQTTPQQPGSVTETRPAARAPATVEKTSSPTPDRQPVSRPAPATERRPTREEPAIERTASERIARERTETGRPNRDNRPDHRPMAREPQRRPLRPRGEERGRPVYRDNRPRRRMAPPPGATRGRYLAPAATPARRGYVVPPGAAAPAGSALGPLLFGLILLLGVLWYAIKHYVPTIDADLTTRTNTALAEAGFGDSASSEIDGRTAILTGNVATDADSQSAEEAVAGTFGVRNVDNQLIVGAADTTQDAATGERTQPTLTFFSTDDGVRLSGIVSDQEYADEIENSAKEIYGEDNVSGSINVDPNSTNPGWWPAVQELTPELNTIDNGSFSVVNGSMRLIGSAADEQTKNDIGAKAEELVAGQLTIENLIKVDSPAPAPEPEPEPTPEPEPEPVELMPAYATYYNSGDAITLFGRLPAESAASIEEAFAGSDTPVANRIAASDRFEAPVWAADFGGSVDAMQEINKAKVEALASGEVIISGIASSEEAKQSAADSIASIFGDLPVTNNIVVEIPEPEPIVPTLEPFASVTDDGTTVTLAGLLPEVTVESLISAFESAGRTVVSNVTADERVIEPTWTEALSKTLESMQDIENAKVTVATTGNLTISGEAANNSDRQRASDNNFDAFGNSVSLRNDITVKGPDISELFASIDLAAIRFRSNSSELDGDSISILNQVADALQQVPDAGVDISGHTDSTGNDQRNLVLSGERAERVKSFLIERGISGDRMTTQGFGATKPIASNDTITGRALNRRIEFALR